MLLFLRGEGQNIVKGDVMGKELVRLLLGSKERIVEGQESLL